MRKKTICAVMTGFLAVQGIEVHAETQQMAGDVRNVAERAELAKEEEIVDETDAADPAESEEALTDEKTEEKSKPEDELRAEEKPKTGEKPETPENRVDAWEKGEEENEEEEDKILPPGVIPDAEKEPAEKREEMEKETSKNPESGEPVEELPGAEDDISEGTDAEESDGKESEAEKTDAEKPNTEKSDDKEPEAEKTGLENSMPGGQKSEESENQSPETKEPEREKSAEKPDAGQSKEKNRDKLESEQSPQRRPGPDEAFSETGNPGADVTKTEEAKTEEQPSEAPNPSEEVIKPKDDIPLQTEESSPPPAETSSESEEEKLPQIPSQLIADFILSQIANEAREEQKPLTIRPTDTSQEVDSGYIPEILLEGAADTAEILSCMVNGSEADYEWKENKICLRAESLSEGYNRITVKVRDADGVIRTMKPWEVNVKPKSSTLVSRRTSRKSKGNPVRQFLRHLWSLIRAIAKIENQTTRCLRALCRK